VELFRPDAVDIFPTDPGGCGCPRCTPYWKAYLDLAEQMLHQAAACGVPTRSINFWFFFNGDAARLARRVAASSAITAVCTQAPHKEDLRERLAISDRLGSRKKVIFWPDITMIGNWGMTGTYPSPRSLGKVFRLAKALDGVLPYSEGNYDEINKYFMLSLAWRTRQPLRAMVQGVLEQAFGEAMPTEAADAVLLMERMRLDAARRKIRRAEGKVTPAVRGHWLWHSLDFFSRYGDVFQQAAALKERTARLRSRKAPGDLRPWRARLLKLQTRLEKMAAELPGLCKVVNDLRQSHELGCGTRPLTKAQLADMTGLEKIKRELDAAIGRRPELHV
jgi:hypothetical protein